MYNPVSILFYLTLAPGISYISDFILGIPGNSLISPSLASTAFGGITGSSAGALYPKFRSSTLFSP